MYIFEMFHNTCQQIYLANRFKNYYKPRSFSILQGWEIIMKKFRLYIEISAAI